MDEKWEFGKLYIANGVISYLVYFYFSFRAASEFYSDTIII